jgi:hypothetical protein
MTLSQETDYEQYDDFPADSHERALDKLTMISQEQQEKLARVPTMPESVVLDLKFPAPKANTAILWNDDETALVNGPTASQIASANAAAVAAEAARSLAELAQAEATNSASVATAAAASLPSLAGNANRYLQVNEDASGYNLLTASEALAALEGEPADADIVKAPGGVLPALDASDLANVPGDVVANRGDLIVGDANGNPVRLGRGTPQQVLGWNAGGDAVPVDFGAGFFDGNQTLITTSGDYTVPDGVTSIFAIVGAGGASGSGGIRDSRGGNGGGAGAIVCALIDVTPGDVIPATIGAGGVGDSAPGGDTTFGTYITSKGGLGGTGTRGGYTQGATSSGCRIWWASCVNTGYDAPDDSGYGSPGGNAPGFGNGGAGAGPHGHGGNASGYSAGGGGSSASYTAGGSGAPGFVMIFEQ